MATNAVTIKFLGDSSGYQKVSNQVAASTETMGKKVSGIFGNVAKVGALAGGAIALHFGTASVNAFKESEAAQNHLETAFAKFPQLAGANIESLRALNTELSKKTRFDDDATASGQAVLAQFGLTGKQLAALTPLVQDYAAKTGKDLTSAAKDVGKALQGKGRALQQVGLNLKDAGTLSGNFEQTVAGLRKQVGGFATAEGKTAAGQAEILKNQFGELQEKVGSLLVPAMTKFAQVGLGVVAFFQGLPGPVQIVLGLAVGLAGAVLGIAKAMEVWKAVTVAFTTVQRALNLAMEENPIGLVVIAIAALAAGIYFAYKQFEPFHNAVDKAWQLLQTGFHWVQSNWPLLLAILTGPIGLAVLAITKNFDSIVGFVKGMPGKIASAASGMWDGIKTAFRSAVNWIIDKWNGLSLTIGGGTILGHKLPSITLDTPNIPHFHTGGIFRAPTPGGEGLAVLRDREQVLTEAQQAGIGMRGPGGTVNNYYVTVETGQPLSTERDISDAVRKAMEFLYSHGGAIGDGRGRFLQPT